ncbi:unnamed protein product [Protopolystoma xenopodis]|uniref:Uncharacterized protein n=1 Tax=Protopolystoma xenopodis TaxID=117903 RepID=A0A3S5CP43_9PLAT|nr:unnamed protein product [Protopolystoma xenopodis]
MDNSLIISYVNAPLIGVSQCEHKFADTWSWVDKDRALDANSDVSYKIINPELDPKFSLQKTQFDKMSVNDEGSLGSLSSSSTTNDAPISPVSSESLLDHDTFKRDESPKYGSKMSIHQVIQDSLLKGTKYPIEKQYDETIPLRVMKLARIPSTTTVCPFNRTSISGFPHKHLIGQIDPSNSPFIRQASYSSCGGLLNSLPGIYIYPDQVIMPEELKVPPITQCNGNCSSTELSSTEKVAERVYSDITNSNVNLQHEFVYPNCVNGIPFTSKKSDKIKRKKHPKASKANFLKEPERDGSPESESGEPVTYPPPQGNYINNAVSFMPSLNSHSDDMPANCDFDPDLGSGFMLVMNKRQRRRQHQAQPLAGNDFHRIRNIYSNGSDQNYSRNYQNSHSVTNQRLWNKNCSRHPFHFGEAEENPRSSILPDQSADIPGTHTRRGNPGAPSRSLSVNQTRSYRRTPIPMASTTRHMTALRDFVMAEWNQLTLEL